MTDKPTFERSYALEDISIRAGDGRTVTAYAAVFNVSAEVHDGEGHYREVLVRSSFDRTISQGAGRFQVLYNHGKDIYGNASERYSMPLGTPLEVRADGRGLLTVTRYAKTPLGDEVLELVRDGAINAQSFGGRFIRSQRVPSARGELPMVERLEVALREFGPTPFPVYSDAAVVGVRSETPPPPSLDAFERRLRLLSRKAMT